MAGPLSHSPAAIVRKMLVDLGLGNAHTSLTWPVFVSAEPDMPDNAITVYDTAGRDHGRVMQGERQGMRGVQVRVRATHPAIGYAKADAVAMALDGVYQRAVSVDGAAYQVHAITRTGDISALGKEAPDSRRSLFTLNALINVRAV